MEKPKFKESFKASFQKNREKIWDRKRARVRLHQSFKRSYREDYTRELEVPGLLYHAMSAFKIIFTHKKIFFGLIILALFLNVVFVGILSEDTYVNFQNALDVSASEDSTSDPANQFGERFGNFAKAGMVLASTVMTGGLNQSMTEVQQVFAIIIFLILWLTTIYLLRHILVGHNPKLRDGLYNSLSPILSTGCVLIVAFIQAIPLMLAIVLHSTAVSTDFLSTPFYALIFFIFAGLMTVFSLYLLSSTVIALIAVTIPGIYPMAALKTASDLVAGRRIRLLIRIVYMLFVLIVVWAIVMIPIILLDFWLKNSFDWIEGIPIVPFFLLFMFCFSTVYMATYIYLFYRRVLVYDNKE
ncbi:hypothetical protein IJI94_00360 [Candidatus Saccharibacteria bacterium]|nr:hypothetical protein [Candidatus Saccharibacteria bacterium]